MIEKTPLNEESSILASAGAAALDTASYSWRGFELMVVAPGVFDASRTAFDFAKDEHKNATTLQAEGNSKEAFYANARAAGWVALSAAYTGIAGVIAADAIFGWTHNAMHNATYGEENSTQEPVVCPPCANGTTEGDCTSAYNQGYSAGAHFAGEAFEAAFYNAFNS